MASSNKMVGTPSVDIRDHEVVILDFSVTEYMDESAALVVGQLIDVAIAEDTECIVLGYEGSAVESLAGARCSQPGPSRPIRRRHGRGAGGGPPHPESVDPGYTGIIASI